MTGGTLEYNLKLTNAGKRACTVEGRPLVRVSSSPYPIVVGGLSADDPQNPYKVPEAPVDLHPGNAAISAVEVWRLCDGAKREMTSGAVRLSFANRSISLPIGACRREGAMILVGPFLVPR